MTRVLGTRQLQNAPGQKPLIVPFFRTARRISSKITQNFNIQSPFRVVHKIQSGKTKPTLSTSPNLENLVGANTSLQTQGSDLSQSTIKIVQVTANRTVSERIATKLKEAVSTQVRPASRRARVIRIRSAKTNRGRITTQRKVVYNRAKTLSQVGSLITPLVLIIPTIIRSLY